MENNKKNIIRLTNAKLCQPVENNRKVDLQLNNKATQKNSRRRATAVNAKNSNDHFSPRNSRQQTQVQQGGAGSFIRHAENRAAHSIDGNGDEASGGCDASECTYSNTGSLHHAADAVENYNGSNEHSNGTAIGPIGGNTAAHSASDQFTDGTRLGKGREAAGKSARGSAAAAVKKSTTFTHELNSVFSGRKKQNHNHLLNFHYASMDVFSSTHNHYDDYAQRANAQKPKHHNHGHNHGYNKELFLQANFQFVIRANARPNFNDSADNLVAWDAIEQINIHTNEEPCCPICLYPPVAAKLTRCGHAYCWPCLLHYLALSDKSWRKCPICYDAVHIGDLKSTAIMQQQVKNGNDRITLQLMHRQKDSMYIEKYVGQTKIREYFPFLNDDDEQQQKSFSKFLLADRADVMSIIDREERELCGREDTDSPEYMFVQQALDLLKKRREEVSAIDFKEVQKLKMQQLGAAQTQIDLEESNMKSYYFYQSIDGQNIYLHPLNIKMLQACYESLNKAPHTIEGRIVQMDHYSMDEMMRKKFTCLGHLPLTRQFAIVEVDIKPPIITQAVMDMFYDDIAYRKLERRRRQCEESKREQKINEINDRQLGKLIASTRNLNLTSSNEFPTCGFDIPLATSSVEADSATQQSPTHVNRATYSAALTVGAKVNSGVANQELWPELASSSSVVLNHSNATKALNCWAVKPTTATKTTTTTTPTAAEIHTDYSSDGEEMMSVPHQNTLSDVLTQAMSQRQQRNTRKATTANKKSKKNKKMEPLFTTGMNFNGN